MSFTIGKTCLDLFNFRVDHFLGILLPGKLFDWLFLLLKLRLSWDIQKRLDCLLNGPCWHRFEEFGRIWIIGHCHVLVAIAKMRVQVGNI